MASRTFAPLVLVALSLAPAAARAQDDDRIARARALGAEGVRAFERGEWEAARSLFHRARDLYPAPTLGVREARTLVKLGRLVEAERVYERVAAAPIDASDPDADVATFRNAQQTAGDELGALRSRIPKITLRVEGSFEHVEVKVDGRAVPATLIGGEREIDPGLHAIDATFDGRPQPPSQVTLAEGERQTLVFRASAPTTAPHPSGGVQRTIGFVTIGLGAVGVGFGIGLGVAATAKHDELDAVCTGSICPPSASATLDDFHALRAASTVAYVAGGVLAAGGLALVLLAPSSKGQQAAFVAPWFGPLAAGLRGAF